MLEMVTIAGLFGVIIALTFAMGRMSTELARMQIEMSQLTVITHKLNSEIGRHELAIASLGDALNDTTEAVLIIQEDLADDDDEPGQTLSSIN